MAAVSQAERHECCHTCLVSHEFGNVYKCHSSGQLHVCDANCGQRVFYDKYSTICRVSRKLFPSFEVGMEDDNSQRCVLGACGCHKGRWGRVTGAHVFLVEQCGRACLLGHAGSGGLTVAASWRASGVPVAATSRGPRTL